MPELKTNHYLPDCTVYFTPEFSDNKDIKLKSAFSLPILSVSFIHYRNQDVPLFSAYAWPRNQTSHHMYQENKPDFLDNERSSFF